MKIRIETLSHQQKLIAASIAVFLLVNGQLLVDIHLPSMPAMQQDFHTSSDMIQQSLSLYLLGNACSLLVYGPLSDRFGRRPALLIGLAFIMIGAIVCTLTHSIVVLLLARLLQGLGAGSISISRRLILHDIYQGDRYVKAMSYSSMIWTLVPLLAPLLGAYIQEGFGWRYNFLTIFLVTLISTLLVIFLLPETSSEKGQQSIKPMTIIRNYVSIISHLPTISFVICGGIGAGMIFGFNTAAPFLFQVYLHLTPIAYAWTLTMITVAYALGAYINGRLTGYCWFKRPILYSTTALFIITLLFLAFALLGFFNLWVIVLPMSALFFALGFSQPQCNSRVMTYLSHMSGAISAISGFGTFISTALFTFIVSHLPEQNQIALAIFFFIASCCLCVIYARFIHVQPRKNH